MNFYTVEDIQDILHISRSTAYNLVNQDDFPKLFIGKQIRIPEEAFEKWTVKNLYKNRR